MATPLSPETTLPPRRRYTSEQIAEYLQAQPRSGLTIAVFCQQHGFHPRVFYSWKRRQNKVAKASPTFREISLPPLLASSWVAEIALPTGAVLRLSAQADWNNLSPWLSELLRP